MPIIYKIDYKNADKPLKQVVDKFGFPNLDADGETQYDNTHFKDEGKAWDALVENLNCKLEADADIVAQKTQELDLLKDKFSRTTALLENARVGYKAYIEKQSTLI